MIREFNEKDLDIILNFGKKVNANYNLKFIGKNDKILVYEFGNRIIGFIQYNVNFEVLDILYIYVLEEYQNLKIGTKLLNFIIENNNIQRIMLEVSKSNKKALDFYLYNNFKQIRIIKNYYNGEDAYALERIIMKDVYILGIETSCDETSISIVKNGIEEIYTSTNTQINTHKKYGGVVPELASRMHTENILYVFEDCLEKSGFSMDNIDAIAVTSNPGLLGSLLVGVEFAKTLSFVYDKPLISVNHLMGHIHANNLTNTIKYPTLGLIVSGGHTELIKMTDDYSFEILGQTLDDSIGECYDKVARVIGLKYPGGPNIEKYAKRGKPSIDMPKPMDDNSLDFSFSGLKSFIINLNNTYKMKNQKLNKYDLACSFQTCAIEQIIRKSKLAIEKTNIKNFIVAGGVSSNEYLRQELKKLSAEKNIEISIPDKKFCTDNAAMIGAAAYPLYKKGDFCNLSLTASSKNIL